MSVVIIMAQQLQEACVACEAHMTFEQIQQQRKPTPRAPPPQVWLTHSSRPGHTKILQPEVTVSYCTTQHFHIQVVDSDQSKNEHITSFFALSTLM